VYAAAECVYFRIYYCKYGPIMTRVYTVNELECYGVNFVVYGYLLETCGFERHAV